MSKPRTPDSPNPQDLLDRFLKKLETRRQRIASLIGKNKTRIDCLLGIWKIEEEAENFVDICGSIEQARKEYGFLLAPLKREHRSFYHRWKRELQKDCEKKNIRGMDEFARSLFFGQEMAFIKNERHGIVPPLTDI